MILAHGVGTRSDLPLPVWLAALGAGTALTISFVVLAVLWRGPRLRRDAGVALPRGLTRVLDATATRILLAGLTLGAAVLVCLVGFLGPADVERNLAPWAFFVTFWVGLVPASALFGPVWRVLNPLRLLHAALSALLRVDRERGVAPLPEWARYWPAAASLAAFGWFELVYPGRAEPASVAWFITVYAVVHTGAAVLFGRRWFERGDGFEVYSTLLGSLSPLGRRSTDRALVLRNPLHGLEAVQSGPGLVGVVVVLIGTTAYDGVSRTSWWQRNVPAGVLNATLGLSCATLLIALVFLIGTWSLVAPPEGNGPAPRPGDFAHTLVPIAAGYAIAHYFSLLIFDGQLTLILASDPFDRGDDLLGLAGRTIDYTVLGTSTLGTSTIASVQITAIVLGHLVAAVAAHDRAVRLLPTAAAVRTQYPLLIAMVALTMGAVGLIFAG